MTVDTAAHGGNVEGRGEAAFGGKTLLTDLLIASALHDETAFARFYELTSPWIFFLLRRWSGSLSRAEDGMRLVYVAIWRRAATFRPPDQSPLAWATTLAYDVAGPPGVRWS